jgi:CubicO group peptidase (beta-lactamase class C family)
LAFVPGTAYRYSSDPFYLLTELVRRTDGTASYAESLQTRLLDPLGMSATSFHPGLAGLHSVTPEVAGLDAALTARWAAFFDSIEAPGGGLWSTAHDLVRFGRATLLGGTLEGVRVLGRPFVELMAREQTAGLFEDGDPPRRPGYGLGWGLPWATGTMPGSRGQVGHHGATGSLLLVDPGAGLIVALLANRWGADTRLADAVAGAVYGALEG